MEYLIESMYDFALLKKDYKFSDKQKLEQIVFKYRKLKKDGNSFFRGIIFNYLENVIFEKNILLIKEILILFSEKITENNQKIKEKEYLINNIKKIETDIVINILYIIFKQMELQLTKKNIEMTPYIVLLKGFLFFDKFDEGMIFFTRYLMYEYIQENENKFYKENKIIKIIDLIPNEYKAKKNGINDFYKDLITMGCEAYNDSIYSCIVPYIFNCSLDVIVYKANSGEAIIQQNEYRSEKDTQYEINLIYKEKDFDIFYKKNFYNTNAHELDNLKNNNKSKISSQISQGLNAHIEENNIQCNSSQYPSNIIKILLSTKESEKKEEERYILESSNNNNNISTQFGKDEYINNIKNIDNNKYKRPLFKPNTMKEKNLSESSIIKMIKRGNKCHKGFCPNLIMNENVLNLCDDCRLNEIKSKILQEYFMYLQIDINKNSGTKLMKYFSKVKYNISEELEIPLMQLISESNLDFNELFTKVRTNICLWCGNNTEGKEKNNFFIKLPCDCKLCSKNCIDKYINNVGTKYDEVIIEGKDGSRENIVMPMSECPCGYKYKLKDFIYMIKTLQKNKLNSYISTYKKQIKNNWKWICLFCQKYFSKKNKYIRIYFKDDNLDEIILDKIEYKHLVCEKCALNNNIKEGQNTKIKCQFCDSEHIIKEIKNVDENNKTDSNCIII